jgi:hypothetical protein
MGLDGTAPAVTCIVVKLTVDECCRRSRVSLTHEHQASTKPLDARTTIRGLILAKYAVLESYMGIVGAEHATSKPATVLRKDAVLYR